MLLTADEVTPARVQIEVDSLVSINRSVDGVEDLARIP